LIGLRLSFQLPFAARNAGEGRKIACLRIGADNFPAHHRRMAKKSDGKGRIAPPGRPGSSGMCKIVSDKFLLS